MTALDAWPAHTVAGWPTDGGDPADGLRDHWELPGETTVTVQGPGGTGKTVLLAALAASSREAGVPVVDVRTAPPPDDVTGGLAILVDDAHRLTPADAARVGALLGLPGVRVAVAYRPWPRPAALHELLEQLRTTGTSSHAVVLGHAGRDTVARWAADELGQAAPPRLVDFVLRQTGGLPALVHPLLRSLARSARQNGELRAVATAGQPARLEIPPEVSDRIAGGLAMLGDDARALLHALAAGAPLDTDLLGEALSTPAPEATDLVAGLRAGGFLLPSGAVIPLVRGTVLAQAPPETTRSVRRRLLGLLLDRGEEPVDLARALAAGGVRDRRAARLLAHMGTRALTTDPVLAGELLDEAAVAGSPREELHTARARAAALVGDFDTALQHADAALQDTDSTDRAGAAAVAAAVLAQRGFFARSIGLYRSAGPERTGALALVLLATGAREAAESCLATGEQHGGDGFPTLLPSAAALTAHGVLTSLGTGPCDVVVAGSLSTLARAIALLEPVGRTALLPDTPAALSALVALHSGEPAMAESVLRRALTTELGGRAARPRHLLLLGWTSMLRGRLGAARAHLADARAAGGDELEPRDELYLRALEMGVARRSSDSGALSAAWEPAREALLRHPVDLFSLLPLAELVVCAARLGTASYLAPYRAAAAGLLARLGNPPVWTTALHWSGLQAAILAGDPAGLGPHASALVAAGRTSRFAGALAQAGRSWLRVLNNDVDAAAVVAAAESLGRTGLAWDGSRLAAQAAARATTAQDRTALLQCARTLAGDETGGAPAASAPSPVAAPQQTGLLSQREREVAELIIAGQTYREVGGRLFISAKTVEHHVARIRQRLGASTRSDLMSRLRAELAEGA